MAPHGYLVLDARRRGVRIRPVHVAESDWLCTIGPDDTLRLGLCYVRGLTPREGQHIVAAELTQARTGTLLRIAGLVICRQRPGTAHGFVFVSLEDETGVANAILTPQLFEQCRLLFSEGPFLIIEGVVQNIGRVIHVQARRVAPLPTAELRAPAAHDFH